MKLKTMIGAAVIVAASAFSAQAVTLGHFGAGPYTGAGTVLPGGLNPFSLTATTGLAVGDPLDMAVTDSTFAAADRLVSDAPQLKYTLLGYEAGFTNFALADGGLIFTNSDAVGSMVTVAHAGGLIDFIYETNNGVVANGQGHADNDWISNALGAASIDSMNFAVFFESARSAILLFGDGTGDVDFDDLAVRVEAVPLPAGILLLLSGLGGLALVGRRRRGGAAT